MIYSIDTLLFLRDILTDVSERDGEGTLVSYVQYTEAILSFDASKSYRANQSDEWRSDVDLAYQRYMYFSLDEWRVILLKRITTMMIRIIRVQFKND